MGQRTRHFFALMKKNWIIWKRTLGASVCELFCPVVLMAIMALARALIDQEEIAPQSNLSKSVLMAPLPSLNYSSSAMNVSSSGSNNTLAQFLSLNMTTQAYLSQYGAFGNFTQTDLFTKNPVSMFLPKHCTATRGYPESPIVAYAGPLKYTEPLTRDLIQLFALQKQTAKLYELAIAADSRAKAALEALGYTGGVNVDFKLKGFSSHQDIVDYLSSSEYQQNDENKGMCFGFSIDEKGEDDLDVRLVFSGQFQDPQTQSIPSQLQPAWDEFSINADEDSYNMYTQQGYSIIQNWIANTVLRVKTGNKNATMAFTLVPTKTDKYVKDDFQQILSGMLPFFMLLIYILPMYRLISNVVSEKESKARESMKMMGLTDFSYWLSWWVYYLIIVTIITVLVLIVLSINVLKYSNRGLIFVYFWIYGLSLFGLAIFLQAFFSRARVAAIAGTLVYFGTSFINAAVADPSVKTGQKGLASLLTTVAVSLGSNCLAQFETSGVGVQSSNLNTKYQNYSLGQSIGVMIISLIIFFLLGLYLDNTLPHAYGLRKNWCFCLSPSFWCGKGKRSSQKKSPRINADGHDEELDAFFEAKYMKRENFEPVSRELQKLEGDNKILKITDLKKTFDNGFQAVRGLNIKMYNGQIFALLGHNGAGKTTTISMLTGLIDSSAGMAEVFGVDIFNDMNQVRNFLGVCPQHDVLFDLLTPEEHLDIFCDFKGVDSKGKKDEIKKMLIDVDVYHHKDIEAGNLSGGSRRKLSVAIALIGGSKLVLLDEPTAGMDLSARRKLWNMLKNYKHNRIIILTTHYMDEADILGDRIGIMTGGKLICLGSSLFLKNRFGVGYNLTMVKKTKENNTLVGPYLQKNLGPEVKMLSEVSSEITYQIPNSLSSKFKNFFSDFDQQLDSLGVRSYGISVTTLEEVFLKVGHGDDTTQNNSAKNTIKESQVDEEYRKFKQAQEDEYTISDPKNQIGGFAGFMQHLTALFLKRFFIYRRNRKGLVVEVLIPVLLVIIGFAFSKVQFFLNQPERTMLPSLYPLKQRILANQYPIVASQNTSWNISPQRLLQDLPSFQDDFNFTYKNYPQYNVANLTQQPMIAEAFDDDVFTNRLVESYFPYRYGSYFIYEANNQTKQFKASVFLNLTSQDVSAAYPQFLYEAVLRSALGKPNFNFQLTTTPYPVTQKLRQRAASASGLFISFIVSIAFALIPSMVISFILNEREKNLKHMQVISGMSLTAYWISNLIFDIVKAIIPSAIVIGLTYAFGLNYEHTWLMFLLYPVGVIPFTYVFSFFFTSENVAQTITIFMHFVFAGIGSIVVFILRLIQSTYSVGDVLIWVFKLIPSYCLTNTIMFDASSSRVFLARPSLKRDSDYDITLVGGDILALCLHFIVWSIVLVLIEMGVFNWVKNIAKVLGKNRIPPKEDSALNLDEDVVEEEQRVAVTTEMKVRVNKFRKIYPGLFRDPVLAVERTSFGLDYGECFALLGINGAGKSTTFKALTCEIPPTSGQIEINGYNVKNQFDKARKLIGYCPQHDAIFDLMTVEEHLEYYARIKGIPAHLRQRLIDRQIVDMNLEDHRKKPAGTLSGGNKRKLSVAMAIIGNPPIILLDEPSAGMDPEARRFMWSVVARISQQRKQSAVILTTHSMEEAEALSTKMGIMVKGGVFRCFGSSQHIKNKYGTGYEIEVKVKKLSPEDIKGMAAKWGFNSQESEYVPLETIKEMMKKRQIDPFLINEIRIGGLGEDLVKEAAEENGKVSYVNFLIWLYVEEAGMTIVNGLCEEFPSVEILEHYSDYYKLRIPRGEKSIGFVFGYIEGQKQQFSISEYSVSQTTLEQIFQAFANMKIDDENARKLTFKRKSGSSRAEIYSERENNVEPKQSFAKGPTPNGAQTKQYEPQIN